MLQQEVTTWETHQAQSMSQVAVLMKGLYWHKNAWKIHKGRWLASRTQLFTFSGAARNVGSLFSKQLMVVRSTDLGLMPGASLLPTFPPSPHGTSGSSCCRETGGFFGDVGMGVVVLPSPRECA